MDKRFKIGNSELVISQALAEYNEFRYSYYAMADEAAARFEKMYREQNKSLGDLARNFEGQVADTLRPVIQNCVEKLFERGIYDIDAEAFLDRYYAKYITVLECFEEYVERYQEIIEENRAEHLYRAQRKASRGRVVGGGFGLEGAAKGMATAGAINLTTGVFHSIGNGIGNWLSNREMNKKMDAIFYNKNTLFELKETLWENVFNIHYAYLDAIEDLSGKKIAKFSMDHVRRAEAIALNIGKIKPEFSKAEPAICEMLLNHPYNSEYYKMLVLLYGDEKLEIQKIGEYFHIDMEAIKVLVLDTMLNVVDVTEIDEYEQVFEEIHRQAKRFGIPREKCEQEMDFLRLKRRKFDLEKTYSAVDKIYLDSREDFSKYSSFKKNNQLQCERFAEELYLEQMKQDKLAYSHTRMKERLKEYGNYREYLFLYGEEDREQYEFLEVYFGITLEHLIIEKKVYVKLSMIQTLEYRNGKILVNNAIPCRFPELSEAAGRQLTEFLAELIRGIRARRVEGYEELLGLNKLFTEAGKEKRKKLEGYILNNFYPIRKIKGEYYLNNLYEPESLRILNNAVRKLMKVYLYQEIKDPVFWCEAPDSRGDYILIDSEHRMYLTATGEFRNSDSRFFTTNMETEMMVGVYESDWLEIPMLKTDEESSDILSDLLNSIDFILNGKYKPDDIEGYTNKEAFFDGVYPIANAYAKDLDDPAVIGKAEYYLREGFRIHTREDSFEYSKHCNDTILENLDEDEVVLCSIKNSDAFGKEVAAVTNKKVYFYIKLEDKLKLYTDKLTQIGQFDFIQKTMTSDFIVKGANGEKYIVLFNTVMTKADQPIFAKIVNQYIQRVIKEVALAKPDTNTKVSGYLLHIEETEEEKALTRERIRDLEELCIGMEEKTLEELQALKEMILGKEYPAKLTDSFIKSVDQYIAQRKEELIRQELEELTRDVETMSKEQLLELKSLIEHMKYNDHLISDSIFKIKAKLLRIDKEEVEELCQGLDQMSIPELKELKKQLKNHNPANTESYDQRLEERNNKLEQEALTELIDNYEQLSREDLVELRKSLAELDYTKRNIEKYSDLLFIRIQELDEELLSELCKHLDTKDRDTILGYMESLKDYSCKPEIIKQYEERMKGRIIAIDENTLKDICPDIEAVSFEEGLAILNRVQPMELREEAKKPFTDALDKQLLKLKREEVDGYIEFAKTLISSPSFSALSNKISMRSLSSDFDNKYLAARMKYASAMGKYEFPILLHDSTLLGGGEEGYLLTHEGIYYKGKLSSAGYMKLYEIRGLDAKKKMLSTELTVYLANGNAVTIPNKLDKNLADLLIQFLYQLFTKILSKAATQGIAPLSGPAAVAAPQQGPIAAITQNAGSLTSPQLQNAGVSVLSPGLKTCSGCGTQVGAHAKFCSGCGKPMSTNCPGCGNTVSPEAKFCGSCGYKLK